MPTDHNSESNSVFAAFFKYCMNDEPPFLALAFYASKHGPNEEEVRKIFEKYENTYACKDEGNNLGMGALITANFAYNYPLTAKQVRLGIISRASLRSKTTTARLDKVKPNTL